MSGDTHTHLNANATFRSRSLLRARTFIHSLRLPEHVTANRSIHLSDVPLSSLPSTLPSSFLSTVLAFARHENTLKKIRLPLCSCRRYDTADDGHADIRDKRLTAARILHEGYRRLDGGVLDLRVRRPPRIRASQLRVTQRHAQRQHKEAVSGERDGAFVVDRSILGAARAGRIRQFRHGQYPETTFLERCVGRARDGFEIAEFFRESSFRAIATAFPDHVASM